MPEREHAPVPYRRCRFDGGCCRADPVAAPASAPSGTHQQKKDQQKKEFGARVSLGAASAARSAGELVVPPSLARTRNRSEMVNAAPIALCATAPGHRLSYP